jgi:lysophospholipase L1-like esterase
MMERTILCFGDSNTWGFVPGTGARHDLEKRWPGVLAAHLGGGYRVVEDGVNGRTTVRDDPEEDGKNGLRQLPAAILRAGPDLVILALGANDLKRVYNATARMAAEGAGQLIEAARAARPEAAVLLLAPAPFGPGIADRGPRYNFRNPEIDTYRESLRFGAEYARVARLKGAHFLNAGDFAAASDADSLHLDEKDHLRLGEAVARAVKGLFEPGPAARGGLNGHGHK